MKKQAGFTLIELIIVIVILGILAVVAAPRFFNFSTDARESVVKGLEGSIKSASELVHARAQMGLGVSPVEVQPGITANLDGQYAEASVAGIGSALSLGTGDWVPLTADVTFDNDTIAWRPASISEGTDWDDETGCYAFYTWEADVTGLHQPQIGSVTNEC